MLFLVLFIHLFDLRLFGFVHFLFLVASSACDCGTPWTFLLPFSDFTSDQSFSAHARHLSTAMSSSLAGVPLDLLVT